MPEYNVSWTIDSVTADSPEEAAQWCRDMLLDPANIASFFHVTDEDGNDFDVDTLVPTADNPDSVRLDSNDIEAVRGARDEWRRRAEQAERSLDEAAFNRLLDALDAARVDTDEPDGVQRYEDAREACFAFVDANPVVLPLARDYGLPISPGELPTATCKHCGRSITQKNGTWVDINATGDDAMWRETCDANETTTAEHEPASDPALTLDEVIDEATAMGLLDEDAVAPPGPASAIDRYGTGFYFERAFDGDWSHPFDTLPELASTLGLRSYPDNGRILYWDADDESGYEIEMDHFHEVITSD
jgi:hypothetical protein